VTRAQFLKILLETARAKKLVCAFPIRSETGFSDVPAYAWYAPYVVFGVDKGIITGYADGTFRPDNNIPRQEAAVIVDRFMNWARIRKLASNENPGNYADYKGEDDELIYISDWARAAVDNLWEAAIMKGEMKDGSRFFLPEKMVKKAEIAKIAYTILGKRMESTPPAPLPGYEIDENISACYIETGVRYVSGSPKRGRDQMTASAFAFPVTPGMEYSFVVDAGNHDDTAIRLRGKPASTLSFPNEHVSSVNAQSATHSSATKYTRKKAALIFTASGINPYYSYGQIEIQRPEDRIEFIAKEFSTKHFWHPLLPSSTDKDRLGIYYYNSLGHTALGYLTHHTGVDMTYESLTEVYTDTGPVFAAGDGYVIKKRENLPGLGLWVYHPSEGVVTVYAHLASISGSLGSCTIDIYNGDRKEECKVNKGQEIGIYSQGLNMKHLHFEVMMCSVLGVGCTYWRKGYISNPEKYYFDPVDFIPEDSPNFKVKR
jgi:murein DD-endopeptidase MepM/ murein hydrolase activator NlpD